jgi:hypothetical protein
MMMGSMLNKTALFITVSAAIMMSGSSVQAAIEPNNLYDLSTVHSLYIVMDAADYNDMAFSSDDKDTGSVYPEEIEPGVWEHTYWQGYLADNQAMTDYIAVAVRRKSDLALPSEADPNKFSLKIDISRPKSGFTPPNQRFGGKKKLSLESGSDNALIKEGLAWNIYNAAGVIASRANWIKVYMSTDLGANFRYMGLYGNVEQPDEEFLEDHMPGRHDYGFLYKITEYNGEILKTREEETNPFEFSWYPFDHPSYMAETVPPPADWLTQTPQRVDMDQLLKFGAVESFISNSDSSFGKGNNYFYYDWATHPTDPNLMDPAYKEPRMYFPWDLDSAFTGDPTDIPLIHAAGGHFSEGLLLEQDESGTPFGYDVYQADYYDTYRGIIDGPLTAANVIALINSVETAISTDLALEPFPEGTAIPADFATIRTFVTDRWDYVDAQLDALAPLPGTVLLDDGFEGTTWDANWTNTVWVSDSTVHGGSVSAKAAAQTAGTFTSINLDTNDANAIHIRFWLQKDDTETADDFLLEYYNGTSYSSPIDLDTVGADDEWLVYTDTITDSQYFVPNFRIRFNASPERNENVWIDDVEISKEVVQAVQYTLTTSSSTGGTVTTPGVGAFQYDDGVAAQITAAADPNYSFVNWTGTGVVAGKVADPNAADTTITMDADYAVQANFAASGTFTLDYAAGPGGSLTGDTAQVVTSGSDGTAVTAVPDTGYSFVDWSDASTDNPRTDTNVTANISVTANFAINTYTLTYTAGANGSISGTTPQTINHGADGSAVTALPDIGYHFVDWSDASTQNPRTDTGVTGDITVTANFAINTYTLTYTAGAGGSITGTTPQVVNHGFNGTAVTAVPDTGYSFVDWSDASTQNPRTDLAVTGNITVTANFAINSYTLTYNAGAGGSITGTTPQTINHGADGSAVTAVPDTGYSFVDWSDASTQNPRTDLGVTGDITVTANFAINTYTLTYTSGGGGSISGTSPQTVNHGADGAQVTAVPGIGYHFVDWSDASTQNPRTDLAVTGDITVTANFAINSYTLTYNAGAGGSITGTTPQTVDHGLDGSAVTAVPDTGYRYNRDR